MRLMPRQRCRLSMARNSTAVEFASTLQKTAREVEAEAEAIEGVAVLRVGTLAAANGGGEAWAPVATP